MSCSRQFVHVAAVMDARRTQIKRHTKPAPVNNDPRKTTTEAKTKHWCLSLCICLLFSLHFSIAFVPSGIAIHSTAPNIPIHIKIGNQIRAVILSLSSSSSSPSSSRFTPVTIPPMKQAMRRPKIIIQSSHFIPPHRQVPFEHQKLHTSDTQPPMVVTTQLRVSKTLEFLYSRKCRGGIQKKSVPAHTIMCSVDYLTVCAQVLSKIHHLITYTPTTHIECYPQTYTYRGRPLFTPGIFVIIQ